MIQVAVVLVSIGLVVLGVKGFTASGIPISKTTTLQGTSGKIAGIACIIGGLLLTPVFLLVIWAFGNAGRG